MTKPHLGIIACVLAIALMLLSCSPYEYQSTSVERLRELIAEAEARSNAVDVAPSQSNKPVVTQPANDVNQSYETTPEDEYDRDYLGYVPPENYGNLTEAEKRGLQTWYFWTGGNEKFFRQLAKTTHGEADFLSLMDARPDSELAPGDEHHYQRDERFEKIGMINDPECKAATQPDEYGLWLDQCNKDPHATGIMGLRKFKNPDFDPEKWDVAAYYQPGEARAQIEPPYRMGTSCGICHIAFNPLNPPNDSENPRWENLDGLIGNQYIREPALFGGNLPLEDFRAQVLANQPPGTSDTSRLPTDHIDNPNSINGIFNLADRPKYEEVMNDGKTIKAVSHILKDGADSIGLETISIRVYLNEGTCSDYWLTLHDPLLGRTPQRPFDIEKARRECEGWRQTEARMPDAGAYLKTNKPMHLEDAPGGKAYLTKDKSVLERGKIVFADNCATCHSSKQPPAEIPDDPEQAKQWYRESVLSSDFLDHNFLSDDKRYPVTEIGTNAARALATNAKKGHIYAQFSSKTYKELPSPGTLELENPFDEDKPIKFKVPAGGTGYYRTPSLISIWSSAPFLNNNMRGKYTGDPSVAGRMKAFNDAIEKHLWPEKREKIIKRTDRDTHLELGTLKAEVPEGTPIKLLANLDPRETPRILQQKLNSDLGGKVLSSLVEFIPDKVLTPLLLKYNQAPDFIEDHGHDFGTDLPDEDKRALIEFLKTF
ncbi:MAG: hypothetical protein QNJ65_09315 [Xenococcaceae cyanobacterium MO_234.B1]|nr:hypothetical protein [Xenococcaceae cyanobacterium MO_234.B1]